MSVIQKEEKLEELLFENWTPFLSWSGFFQTVKQKRKEQKGIWVILDPLIFCTFALWVKPILMCINLDEKG